MHFSAIAQVLLVFALLTAPMVFDLWLRGNHREPVDPVWSVDGGDFARGRQSIIHYGCGACHVIPGIGRADGRVGPRLDDIIEQVYIAGVLPHSSDNLVRWIRNPQTIDPDTAMPNLGVGESEARDIVAFLYAQ